MILYHNSKRATWESQVFNVIESIFNIEGKSPMYLRGDCLEYMDKNGIVWRVEFDFADDRDAFLSEFQYFGGTITKLASDTDMSGMHISYLIPTAAVSSNASNDDANNAEIRQLQQRVEQSERRAEQFERRAEQFERCAEQFEHRADQFGNRAEQFDGRAEQFERWADQFGNRTEQFERRAEQFERRVTQLEDMLSKLIGLSTEEKK